MNCLIVHGDWIEKILSGEKTVETSGQALTRGGAAPGAVYLRGSDGIARGVAVLGPRIQYASEAEFRADEPRHCVPTGAPFDFGRRARTYGFPILSVRRLSSPVRLKTPRDQRRFKPVEGVEIV